MTDQNDAINTVRKLLAQGRHDDARTAAAELVAEFPNSAMSHLVRVDCEIASENADQARIYANAMAERFPGNVWSHIRLADISRHQGHPEEGLEILQSAQRSGVDSPHLRIALADAWQAAGQPGMALETYRDAVTAFPDHPQPPRRQARLLMDRGQPEAALGPIQAALELAPTMTDLHVWYIQCLEQLERDQEACSHVEIACESGQASPRLFLEVARICRKHNDTKAESTWLSRGLASFPRDPQIVQFLVTQSLPRLDEKSLAELAGDLLEPATLERFKARIRLRNGEFEASLEALRNEARGLRDVTKALQVAEALVALNRGALARRYLRFALRKWPRNWPLINLFIRYHVRTLHEKEALDLLADTRLENPVQAAMLEMHKATLFCGLRDLDGAMGCFRRALPMADKVVLNNQQLLRSLMSAGRWSDLEEVIGPMVALGAPGASHLRSTLMGQLVTEYQVTRSASPEVLLPETGVDFARHVDNVLRHPGSTLAAMQMVETWRQSRPLPLVPAEPTAHAAIPQRIFQYWHEATPPSDISGMIDTWRATPGFEHDLFDRDSAIQTLRSDFGPRWLQAFRMAKTPTEEADYLRLCLVARHGGVYADADDIRAGDLAALLDHGAGAVVHLAQFGGNFGNNFFAACPEHPLFIMAARTIRQALLSRSNETVWQKAGPGFLTRIVARYVSNRFKAGQTPDLAVLTPKQVEEAVVMHNTARHKMIGQHWNASNRKTADYLALLQSRVPVAHVN